MAFLRRRGSTPQAPTWAPEIDETFPQCARLVRAALATHRERYARSANRYLRWFRSMGVVEIFLSLGLPVIALTDLLLFNEIIIAVLSIVIAGIAALRTFFRLHENWQLFQSQALALEILVREWEFKILCIMEEKPDDQGNRALDLTGQFLDRLHEALRGEYESYVESVQMPRVPRLGTTAGGTE